MPDERPSGADAPMNEFGKTRRQKSTASYKGRRGKSRHNARSDLFAALDLGTNNCRLLIARPGTPRFRVVDSYSRVVRLGAGLTRTGRLSQESMDAAVEAIQQCSKKMGVRRVKRWRCVATQACRQAKNGEEFLTRVKSETGISLEIISARVEARLAVMGCMNLIDMKKDVVLVVDIGGGSTELSWVDVRQMHEQDADRRITRPPISAWASLPLGVVTLSEQVPDTGNLAERYETMKTIVRQAITDAGCENRFTKVFSAGRGHIIGTSGTVTSLAALHLKLPVYQRDKIDGLWMKTRTAVDIAREISLQTVEERAKAPSIGIDRAHLLVAGCAIMDVVCELWPSRNIRVADRGLREGILMGLMHQSARNQSTDKGDQDDDKSA